MEDTHETFMVDRNSKDYLFDMYHVIRKNMTLIPYMVKFFNNHINLG